MPHDVRIHKKTKKEMNASYVPAGLFSTKLAVYDDFVRTEKKKAADENRTAQVPSYSLFYKVWKHHYWFMFLKYWIPFAKCDHCVDLLEKIRTAENEAATTAFKQAQDEHRAYITKCREAYAARVKLAEDQPSKYLSIISDAMDNNKTNIPHWRSFYSKDRTDLSLKTRLLGVLVHHKRFDAYWTLPRYEHSSNLTITALLKTFENVLKDDGFLPPILFLQLDNCGKENKCNNFFAFLGQLIELKVFQEIHVNFLPVGHTHSDIDQKYSVISFKLSQADAYTIQQLKDLVADLFTKKLKVDQYEIPCILRLQSVLEPKKHCFHIKGLGTVRDGVTKMKRRAHSFRILLHESKACLMYKEHDVPQELWLGHHLNDEPIPLFTPLKYEEEAKG